MGSIINESQLTNALMNAVFEAFQDASNETQDSLKINLWDKVYSKPSSKYYKRTRPAQLMKSVISPKVKITGKQVEVKLGMDTDIIQPEYRKGTNTFNAHMNQDGTKSFKEDPYSWHGTPVHEALPIWYDEGTYQDKTKPKNNRLPSVDKTNFWYDAMGSRLTDKNPDYEKAYKRFEEELTKNLMQFGSVMAPSKGGF